MHKERSNRRRGTTLAATAVALASATAGISLLTAPSAGALQAANGGCREYKVERVVIAGVTHNSYTCASGGGSSSGGSSYHYEFTGRNRDLPVPYGYTKVYDVHDPAPYSVFVPSERVGDRGYSIQDSDAWLQRELDRERALDRQR